MSTEDPNWRNVGNWHWVSKDVSDWAREQLRSLVLGVKPVVHTCVDGSCRIFSVSDVSNVEGDCIVNVRKRKFITIYDMSLKVGWSSTSTTSSSTNSDSSCESEEIKGVLFIRELTHDSATIEENNDLVVTNELHSSTFNNFKTLKQRTDALTDAKSALMAEIRKVFSSFTPLIIGTHAPSVFIENAVASVDLPKIPLSDRLLSTASNSAAESSLTSSSSSTQPKPKEFSKKANTTNDMTKSDRASGAKTEGKKENGARFVSTLNKNYVFYAPPGDVIDCFTNIDRLRTWSVTGGDVWTGSTIGSEMSLMGGQVTGTIVEIDPKKRLVFTWRLRQWGDHNARATFELNITKTTSNETTFDVKFENVPTSDSSTLENLWLTIVNQINSIAFGHNRMNI